MLASAFFSILCLTADVTPRTPFTETRWRYDPSKSGADWLSALAVRTVLDLVAIPASVVGWNALDYNLFAATALLSIAPVIPVDGRSLDARVQDGLHQWRGANCAYATRTTAVCPVLTSPGFRLWSSEGDPILVAAFLTLPLVVLGASALAGDSEQVEAGTLAIEAVLVSQVYHLSMKVLTGREGPLYGTGAGTFHGPTLRYAPDGYPSGHATALFAIAGVYSTYFDEPLLTVATLGAATLLSTFLVLDDSHYVSEVILGAAMGYAVGRWVVTHRASLTNPQRGIHLSAASMAPIPNGIAGSLLFTW